MDRFFRIKRIPGAFVLTMLLSAGALLAAILDSSPDRWLRFAAMALSSVGDILLMNLAGLSRFVKNNFFWGAGAFMGAHLLYLAGYFALLDGRSPWNPGFFLALAFCLTLFILFRGKITDRTIYPIFLPYFLVITANTAVISAAAWALFPLASLSPLAALGAVSFLLSDAIIALSRMCKIHRYNNYIWWLYPIGQALILFVV